MGKLKVIWTNRAKAQLKSIHDYIKYIKKSPQGAANVRKDILQASRSIVFETQYQQGNNLYIVLCLFEVRSS